MLPLNGSKGIMQSAVKEYIDRGESVVSDCNRMLENRASAGDYQALGKEFWSGTKGNKVLSVTIEGNDE